MSHRSFTEHQNEIFFFSHLHSGSSFHTFLQILEVNSSGLSTDVFWRILSLGFGSTSQEKSTCSEATAALLWGCVLDHCCAERWTINPSLRLHCAGFPQRSFCICTFFLCLILLPPCFDIGMTWARWGGVLFLQRTCKALFGRMME